MDKEKTFQEFTEMVTEISKLSSFKQWGEYPRQVTAFFEKIYQEGYSVGYIDGLRNKEITQSKQN
jgi:hypothetical protein